MSVAVEVRHSMDPQCVALAAAVAAALGCPTSADPPEGEDRSVRVLAGGRQLASMYLGVTQRTDEWIERMAQSLVRAVTAGGFGGQGTVDALRHAHGAGRYDADRITAARRKSRARDGLRRTHAARSVVDGDGGE